MGLDAYIIGSWESGPYDLVDVGFSEPDAADRAFSVAVGCRVIDTFLAKYVWTSLQYHLTLSLGTTST
jgi:hypothetical protein